jgi:hypothetical protein
VTRPESSGWMRMVNESRISSNGPIKEHLGYCVTTGPRLWFLYCNGRNAFRRLGPRLVSFPELTCTCVPKVISRFPRYGPSMSWHAAAALQDLTDTSSHHLGLLWRQHNLSGWLIRPFQLRRNKTVVGVCEKRASPADEGRG